MEIKRGLMLEELLQSVAKPVNLVSAELTRSANTRGLARGLLDHDHCYNIRAQNMGTPLSELCGMRSSLLKSR